MIPIKKPPKVSYSVKLPADLLDSCKRKNIDLPKLFEQSMKSVIVEFDEKQKKAK